MQKGIITNKHVGHDKITLIERIPEIDGFMLCFSLRCGSLFVGISGIVVGCVSFLTYLLLLGRNVLDPVTILLLLLLSVLAIANVMFIAGSVLLVVAACCETPDFIPAYIWICVIYWATQLFLAIFIPIVLMVDGGSSFFVGLAWSCLIMTLALTWTHYLACAKSYMWQLYQEVLRY